MTGPPPRPREDRPLAAAAIMAGAVVCFTVIDSTAKWLVIAGFPAIQVVFARYAGHLAAALAAFLPGRGLEALRSRRPRVQLLRALALLGSTTFNFLALTWLPLNVTTAIMFAGPIVVSLMSIPILGERVGARRLTAVAVGFVGVLVIVQPWGAQFHWAMLLSLGALMCASFYFVLTRLIAGVDDNATSQIWSSGVATLAVAPPALDAWVWPQTPLDWGLMAGIGLFGALGHSMATVAHRFAEASALAPVVYGQVITATFASWLLFAALPTRATILGTAIIVLSGVYIWLRERRRRVARPAPEAALRR